MQIAAKLDNMVVNILLRLVVRMGVSNGVTQLTFSSYLLLVLWLARNSSRSGLRMIWLGSLSRLGNLGRYEPVSPPYGGVEYGTASGLRRIDPRYPSKPNG